MSATLVLGGTRSGKSVFAERLVLATGLQPLYIATATAFDEGMEARIGAHRARRDGRWGTVEEPLELVAALAEAAVPGRAVLVDCLTLWLTNLMMAGRDVGETCAGLVGAARAGWPAPVVLVSNEVGLGGVALTPMGRAFADQAGRLHQELATALPRVAFMVAGLPLWLKGEALPTAPMRR